MKLPFIKSGTNPPLLSKGIQSICCFIEHWRDFTPEGEESINLEFILVNVCVLKLRRLFVPKLLY